MKTFLITLLLFLILSTNTPVTLALDDVKTRPSGDKFSATGTASGKITNRENSSLDKTGDLKNRAGAEIQRRIAALEKLISKINSFKGLSDAQKSSFISQIQAQINSLTALKTKIESGSDLNTIRADIKSIVTDYRIFSFFIENINIVAAADRMDKVISNVMAVYDKLKSRVDRAESNGKNVTNLNNLLASMLTKINHAKTLVTEVKADIAGITIEGYPGNKSLLLAARTKLRSAFADIKSANSDAKLIVRGLTSLGEKKGSGSSSAKLRLLPNE